MKLVHIKNPNFEVMKKIVEIEQEAFEGAGNVDLWIVKALIRYGMVFVIEEDNKIVCIVEYMQIFNKKSLFLYGISTLKKRLRWIDSSICFKSIPSNCNLGFSPMILCSIHRTEEERENELKVFVYKELAINIKLPKLPIIIIEDLL